MLLKLLVFIKLLLLLSASHSTAETLIFAPIPLHTKETLFGSHLPLVQYLKKKTGLPIELSYIADYHALFEEFKKGKVAIITSGPLPYVELQKDFPHAKALVHFREKDGSTSYSCVLVTSARGPKRLDDVKGPLALTQKGSTCGYFSANILLSRAGKDIKRLKPTHLMTHNEVVESVIRGQYEIGSLKKDVAEQYKGYAIKILAESPKWPGFSLIVNTKVLSKEAIQKIKDTLINLSPDDAKTLVVGRHGFAEAKEKDFDLVRDYERYR